MLNERNIPLEEDGIEEEILVDEEAAITKAMWGDIGGNIANQTDLQNALDAKQDSLTEAQLNAVNSGITSEKVTTYDGYADQIASKANQSALNAEATTRQQADTALGRRIDDEATARQQADNGLQTQIDAITSKSDVVDVVANYAALQAYDTSSLGNNDVIKVLDDETHEDALTYYRWSTTTQTWSYIGQEAPYYSKGQMDVKLAEKQDKLTAGANIQIQNGTISATDTTYTAGNGLNLDGTEFSADTDILATKEDLEDYYTKPETDNLLAPKLEAEVVAELPTTGEEGKLYLTPKAHTTQTATGNPITATVAEDAGALESFQLDGDTTQYTYNGGNLFDSTIEQGVISSADGTNTGDTATNRVRSATQSVAGYGGKITISAETTISGKTLQFVPRYYDVDGNYVGNGGFADWLGMPTTLTPTPSNARYIRLLFRLSDNSDITPEQVTNVQITGATSAPNPDYPQPIRTVTGEQTVEVVGKNLLPTYVGLRTVEVSGAELRFDSDGDKVVLNSDYSAQTASAGQQIEITTGDIRRWAWTTIEAIESAPDRRITPNGGEYTASMRVSSGEWSGNTVGSFILVIGIVDDSTGTTRLANKTLSITEATGPYNVTQNISLGDNEHIRNIAFYTQNIIFNNAELTVQLELGSTATDYAPYSKQTLPIDLGTIELCKLGTYQDYIYKDGDDWKVHKATVSAIIDGSENWDTFGTNTLYVANIYSKIGNCIQSVSAGEMYASHFTIADITGSNTQVGASLRTDAQQNLSNLRIRLQDMSGGTAGLKQMLSAKKPSIYARRLTPTDTVITDTTLIAQLEAIRTASLENGANTITNTATGSNLAGDMEIGYYGYNPRNRYDKWLWLDINNEYEQIGS